jgi:DNA polymerase/3'-5' exonuclease PolX
MKPTTNKTKNLTHVKVMNSDKEGTKRTMEDHKHHIIENLKVLRSIEQGNKQTFKAIAYNKVIKALELHTDPIMVIEDVDKIKGVGKGIRDKIDQIMQTGFTGVTKDAMDGETELGKNIKALEELTKVMSIGPVKAKSLLEEHSIRTVVQLRDNLHLLNEKQKLGVQHHDDFVLRIPRKEMEKHYKYISEVIDKIDNNLMFEMTGSFRRLNKDSGDIDILVTYKHGRNSSGGAEASFKKVIALLQSWNYLTDHFAYGESKYNGIAHLKKHKHFRRIDIMYTSPERFPFALLYFTGSQEFNIKMRKKALDMGYSLNEYGLKHTSQELKTSHIPVMETEKDVFKFLKMEWVEPEDR